MNAKPQGKAIVLITVGLLIFDLLISSCQSQSGKHFEIIDFEAVHSPVGSDGNTYLIFGNMPTLAPVASLSPQLAVFLGRWEGYDYSLPVKKDYKMVLFIQDISPQGGTAYIWLGTNLQYPSVVQKIPFQIVNGPTPAIQFRAAFGTTIATIKLVYNASQKMLKNPDTAHRPIELSQTRTFYVYKDYSQYLASKQIYARTYLNETMQQYGNGYLLYLPEGYADNSTSTWPLILFFHGSGDQGDNVFLLAKASPFMYIREKGALPFIIVAPLLKTSYKLFPMEYMDGVLAEIQSAYRVDPKRIYLTGLSLGGEAIYRLAIQKPDTFAVIAPLSAGLEDDQIAKLNRIKNLPVWVFHGENDTIIPLAVGRKPADALTKLGGNIKLTILQEHDHDTWTDTYSSTILYDWFMQHQRP